MLVETCSEVSIKRLVNFDTLYQWRHSMIANVFTESCELSDVMRSGCVSLKFVMSWAILLKVVVSFLSMTYHVLGTVWTYALIDLHNLQTAFRNVWCYGLDGIHACDLSGSVWHWQMSYRPENHNHYVTKKCLWYFTARLKFEY